MRGQQGVALALCVILAESGGAHSTHIDVRFDRTGAPLVVVPAQLNGRGPFRLLVDTGATSTMLDRKAASALGLVPTATLEVVTASGSERIPEGMLGEVGIGRVRVSGLRVSWMSLDAAGHEGPPIDGVLGHDVLSRIVLSLDFARGVAGLGYDPCEPGDESFATERADGRPLVEARIHVPGLPSKARLVLDSGASALLLFSDVWPANRATTSLRTFVAEMAVAPVGRTRVDVGGLTVSGPAVLVPRRTSRIEDGLLPTSWFSHVCLDGPRELAVLTR